MAMSSCPDLLKIWSNRGFDVSEKEPELLLEIAQRSKLKLSPSEGGDLEDEFFSLLDHVSDFIEIPEVDAPSMDGAFNFTKEPEIVPAQRKTVNLRELLKLVSEG